MTTLAPDAALRVPWAELAAALSPRSTLATGSAERAAVATDWSGHRPEGVPDAVVRAGSAEDVAATLRFASAHRVPVVPRGAGTGVSGGASAGSGSLVLDLRRMDAILDLRPADAVAVVQSGVLTADLDRAAREHGLRYTPDPASAAISTLGGNIATNAGGLRCVKYGVTRDAVLALEVVLADGSRVRTGRSTLKGVAGYDLTSLLVGSEGTLGVVVEATLRLQPVSPTSTTATAAVFLPDGVAAADAALLITGTGVRPSTLELLDGPTLAALDEAHGSDLAARGGALLLVQTDGEAAEAELATVTAALAGTAASVEVAADEDHAERLLTARRAALPAIERRGRVLVEDIAVPRSALGAAVRGVAEIAARHGVPIYTFAHAGDGNLHPIIAAEPDGPDGTDHGERVASATREVFELALRLGGTVTGEHGIGLLKRSWLPAELGPAQVELQRRIKAVFDPLGILNPGKAIA